MLITHSLISDMIQSLLLTAWLNNTHHLSADVTCSLYILPNHKISDCGRLNHVTPYQVADSVRCWKGSSQHHITQFNVRNVTKQTSVPLQHIYMSDWIMTWLKFMVCKSVHHHTINWINQQDAATSQVYYLSLRYSSTCRPDHNQQHCYHHAPTVNQRLLLQLL